MTKLLLVGIIALLCYNSPEVRHTIADGLEATADTIRPTSKLQRQINEAFRVHWERLQSPWNMLYYIMYRLHTI